jgi:hypothetical protein
MKIWYKVLNLSPVTTTPAIIFSPGVVYTCEQVITGVIDTSKKHKVVNISMKVRKILEWPHETDS